MGFFGGHIVAVLALVSGACPPARLGWALGWLSTSQLAGMLLGPLIGGSIADALDSYRAPFVAGGCASLIVAFVVLRLPKQLPPESTTSTAQPTSTQVLKIYPDLLMIIVVLLLAQFAITSAGPIVSLYVQRLTGPVENLATLAGVAFSVIGLSGLIAAPQIGRAGDLVGRRRLLIAVLLAAAVFTLAQSIATTYSVFVAERFVAGLFLGGVIPLSNSLAAQCVTAAHRGRAFGLIGSATFLGAFIGPLGGGMIDAHFGPSPVFATASAALALAAIAAYRLKISER
jgi:DHA1 family multidrug resistance protein-like MFS transporter